MKNGDNQSSIWTTKVIVPAIAIIAAGIATAISDDLRTGIKNLFSHKQDTKPPADTTSKIIAVKNDKVTVELILTNKNAALREDTVIFDDGEAIYTDDAGKCFKQVIAGAHAFRIHAFSKVFHYSFFAPNKPDSLYTLAQDINYDLPATTLPDTGKKAPVNPHVLTAAAIQASRLPAARMKIYTSQLTPNGH